MNIKRHKEISIIYIYRNNMTNKYEESKIYKLVNSETNDIYVGSTIKRLSQRMAQHRLSSKQNVGRKLYARMNDIGVDKFMIILVEKFPCKDRDELNAQEYKHIAELKPTLNTYQCNITNKRNSTFKDYYANDEWRKKHLDYILTRIPCECGFVTSRNNLTRHKKGRIHKNNLAVIKAKKENEDNK